LTGSFAKNYVPAKLQKNLLDKGNLSCILSVSRFLNSVVFFLRHWVDAVTRFNLQFITTATGVNTYMKNLFSVIFAIVISICPVVVNAALIDRGNGMIYDSDLNITWLQDANYAKTSHYQIDYYDGFGQLHTYTGQMSNWVEAKNWAESLVYGGYDDWRLPKSLDTYFSLGNDGTTSGGYNVITSEMGYLYYIELGNAGYRKPDGTIDQNWGLKNPGLFTNIQPFHYWSETTRGDYGTPTAYYFNMNHGEQQAGYLNYPNFYAWAVRDGDIESVPEPGMPVLLSIGLAGLVCAGRLKRKVEHVN
jgi:hypothetical protein